MKPVKKLLGLIIFSCLSACNYSLHYRQSLANEIAARSNFEHKLIKGGSFLFTTYQKITQPNLPFVIYIEGDGTINHYRRASDNPTPNNPMTLRLAVQDLRPNVIYLARPCQYTPEELSGVCQSCYWLNKRWAPEVVSAMDEAIKSISFSSPLDLVGFSGGGGIAVLLAAQNPQVRSILTIAGNLDIVAFNKYHAVPQSTGSLNPLDYAQRINHIPQLHLSGAKDAKVPPFIASNFVTSSQSTCVKHLTLAKFTHHSDWIKDWPQLLQISIN